MMATQYLCKVDRPRLGQKVGLLIGADSSGGLVLFEDGSVDFYDWDRIRVNLREAAVAFGQNVRVLDQQESQLVKSTTQVEHDD